MDAEVERLKGELEKHTIEAPPHSITKDDCSYCLLHRKYYRWRTLAEKMAEAGKDLISNCKERNVSFEIVKTRYVVALQDTIDSYDDAEAGKP